MECTRWGAAGSSMADLLLSRAPGQNVAKMMQDCALCTSGYQDWLRDFSWLLKRVAMPPGQGRAMACRRASACSREGG